MSGKLNENPTVHAVLQTSRRKYSLGKLDEMDDDEELKVDPFDSQEVFELICDIQDPEHPLTLEQLNVLECINVHVNNYTSRIEIFFTPTVPHCSMSTLIGLSIRVKLLRSLPPRFKVDIYVMPGSHQQESQVNKQLNDKERVAAALENSHLLQVVNKCLTAIAIE